MRVAVVCTHAVPLCADCLHVHGPAAARVAALRPVPHLHGRGYEAEATWEEQYRGPVRVSLKPRACAPAPLGHVVGKPGAGDLTLQDVASATYLQVDCPIPGARVLWVLDRTVPVKAAGLLISHHTNKACTELQHTARGPVHACTKHSSHRGGNYANRDTAAGVARACSGGASGSTMGTCVQAA